MSDEWITNLSYSGFKRLKHNMLSQNVFGFYTTTRSVYTASLNVQSVQSGQKTKG